MASSFDFVGIKALQIQIRNTIEPCNTKQSACLKLISAFIGCQMGDMKREKPRPDQRSFRSGCSPARLAEISQNERYERLQDLGLIRIVPGKIGIRDRYDSCVRVQGSVPRGAPGKYRLAINKRRDAIRIPEEKQSDGKNANTAWKQHCEPTTSNSEKEVCPALRIAKNDMVIERASEYKVPLRRHSQMCTRQSARVIGNGRKLGAKSFGSAGEYSIERDEEGRLMIRLVIGIVGAKRIGRKSGGCPSAASSLGELKGYKVTDVNRIRKVGVACRSLQELKRKACAKLNVTNDLAEINVYLLDGSLIDEEEYFSTLKPQTTLILQKPGEKVLSDADLLYNTLRRVNIDILIAGEKASEFLTENLKAKVAVLNNVLNKDDSKTMYSSRDEHPEWFRGLETNCTTKEAYLHRRCQDRIRGYLYKTIEQIKSSDAFTKDPRARKQLLYAIAFFKMQLKEDHYFGFYFDRSRAKTVATKEKETCVALCDHTGEFRCWGQWNEEKCSYGDRHKINPYRSKEELILFSTWNFDHKIERSRTLIPLLLKLASQGNTKETDLIDIYDNLFTMKNLRLIHIVCHDKSQVPLGESNHVDTISTTDVLFCATKRQDNGSISNSLSSLNEA
ncbi:hypothetical protein WN48_10844 [Eufriesea mexicana]|uniref:CIDE-N domain-containing protein n=1 Tax=Eufriesea mexicana TaxID=516756 RepID=A0A310SHW6_9HYME|nr:hypothetical protein WN48_10844 [Eufriesea mexicana]